MIGSLFIVENAVIVTITGTLKKTKPDSLTNQGLPGLNIANLCCFFIINKFLLVFYFSNASI